MGEDMRDGLSEIEPPERLRRSERGGGRAIARDMQEPR